jgi:preprotein translocase subunit SecB
MTTPFTLKRHYPIKVEYWASEDAVVQPAELDTSYAVSLGSNTASPLDWRVALIVKFSAKSEKKEIARGEVVFVGYFGIPDNVPESDRQKTVGQIGASVLYNATRELIANLTCRSTNRHITLPLTSFHDLKFDPNAAKEVIEAQI